MVTYKLQTSDKNHELYNLTITAASAMEMDFCLRQHGFVMDERGYYVLHTEEISYWVMSQEAMHVADLKGIL